MRVGPGAGRRAPDAGRRAPDAMKPDFHRLRTHWNRGFMAFQQLRRTRIVMLVVPD